MKNLIFSLLFLIFAISCIKKEVEHLPSNSIYNLSSTWQNQDNKDVKFKDFIGKNMVVVMIYTSCKTACPLLVADMKTIKSKIPENLLKETNLVLVSIDPEVDTPEKLNQFAKTNNMYGAPWIFLRGDKDDTNEFANVLSMKFKEITPMNFSHSNIISIFNKKGEMMSQEEGAGINAEKVVEDLKSIKN
ncbi:SCO family protein [Halpernia sp.]|uniref:SCO family protein n=1 Tax=Halpernia sp. TaxID=2782209 RepID=UPI003A94D26F